MASVLILDWSVSNRGCVKAFGILKTAWEMNLLHAKFVCLDRMKRRLLYSYNPYTSRAPHPWKLVTTYRQKNGHPWALFVQGYRQGKEICNELDFEKTNDLGGYEIRARANNITGMWKTDPNKNGTDSFSKLDGNIARFIFYALNVTPKVVTYNHTYSITPIIQEGKTVGGDVDVKNGVFDMGLNSRFPDINSTLTRPIRQSGIVALTQYRGYMSQLAKFAAVIDRSSKIGLLLVALITVIFFKCVMHQALMPAFLNVWRIYCNSFIPKIPKTHAPRLYLTALYLLMINIQAIYQGKMSALVTKAVAIRDIETMQHIAKFGLTVYGAQMFAPVFADPVFKNRFVVVDGGNCTVHVLNDYWGACVHEENRLTHEAMDFKLHVSVPIVKLYRMYVIRPDWPLERRINTILERLVESGIVQHSDKKDTQKILRELEIYENRHGDQTFKIMTLPELTFAFELLGIGLTFSIISFIVEIGIVSARFRITRARVSTFTIDSVK